jgi:O-antigen ligase
MSKSRSSSWLSWLTAVVIVTIPSNLFWQIPFGSPYVHGLRVDYLIPKLPLSLLAGILLSIAGWKYIRPAIKTISISLIGWIMITLGILLTIKQFTVARPISALFLLCLWIGAGWLWYCLRQLVPQLKPIAVWWGIMAATLIQIVIGWYQLLVQHSLTPYRLFGEPDLSSWSGLTRGEWFGQELILPYGTTPHPNVLASFLVIMWYLSWHWQRHVLQNPIHDRHRRLYQYLWQLLTIALVGLVIATQSLSGLLSLILAVSLVMLQIFRPQQLFSLKRVRVGLLTGLLVLIGVPLLLQNLVKTWPTLGLDLSWERRNELFITATHMWRENPIWGVGINHFTVWQEQYRSGSEIVRFVQPAHTIFWLLMAETGVAGLSLSILLAWIGIKKFSSNQRFTWTALAWVLLLPAAALDHFLLTQQVGLVTMAMLFSLLPKSEC